MKHSPALKSSTIDYFSLASSIYARRQECGKLTFSSYDYCDTHAKKYCARGQYHRKKLEKLSQIQL